MSVVTDCALIARDCQKVINITAAAVTASVQVLPNNDLDGETTLTLTAAQKLAILGARAALLAEIKTLAAGLPSA